MAKGRGKRGEVKIGEVILPLLLFALNKKQQARKKERRNGKQQKASCSKGIYLSRGKGGRGKRGKEGG